VKGWIKDIVIAGVIALLIMTFIKPTIVKESSMEPTLYANNYLFLSKQQYRFSEPQRGDIVVFHTNFQTEDGKEKLLIKRVIAVPGDVVTIENGDVYINNTLIYEPYINGDSTSGYIDNLTVPQGQVFAMGDNRGVSIDSRNPDLGCIPADKIVGKAFLRLYPFNQIGLLN
jgi:signal peptidase I